MSLLQSTMLVSILIAISGFFSIAEIALAAARNFKLEQLVNKGELRAQLVLDLQAHPGYFFTAIQIGLNTVAILAGVIGERAFAQPFTTFFLQFTNLRSAQIIGAFTSFSLVTSLFIVIADLIPKRIGMVLPEDIAVYVVKPIMCCVKLLNPFIWLFNGLANLFFALFRLPTGREDNVTLQDIATLANAGAKAGVLAKTEHQVIENLLEFEQRTVPSTMTARENIVWIDQQDNLEKINIKISANPYAKYPVCIRSIDQVVGYIDSKDMLSKILNGEKFSPHTDHSLHTVLMLPEALTLAEILKQFKSTQEDFALIINEYALVVGLITLNDVTGALMGDLVNTPIEEQIVQRDDNSWLVDGITTISDIMQALDIDSFPDSDRYETIAGFMMYTLRKVPKRTDFTVHRGFKFEVVDVDNFKIDQLLVTSIVGNNKA